MKMNFKGIEVNDETELWTDFMKIIKAYCHACVIHKKECDECWVYEIKEKWNLIEE